MNSVINNFNYKGEGVKTRLVGYLPKLTTCKNLPAVKVPPLSPVSPQIKTLPANFYYLPTLTHAVFTVCAFSNFR